MLYLKRVKRGKKLPKRSLNPVKVKNLKNRNLDSQLSRNRQFKNSEIAAALNELADYLEANSDNPYKIRAYRRAARIIFSYPTQLTELIAKQEDLKQIQGIGAGIAWQIEQILENKLFLTSQTANREIKLTKRTTTKQQRHFRIHHLIPLVEKLIDNLKMIKGVYEVEATGDYRRRTEIVNELQILVAANPFVDVTTAFAKFPQIKELYKVQKKYVHGRLHLGIDVHLKVISKNCFGSYLLFYTGNNDHYAKLNDIAQKNQMLLQETGLFKDSKKISGESEKGIYEALKLKYIPAELRENRGEIEAAKNNTLPKLIQLSDIKGDLHCHTFATDGTESIETMARAAQEYGYEYLAITDHTQNLKITNGLDEKRLLEQIKLIDKINNKYHGIYILKSTEMDILRDGSLDLPDSVLKELDFTVCSVHSHFRISLEEQTERIIRAMDNPYFTILGHATGRLIRKRDPYELNMEKIMDAAKARGCFIEINAQPWRLDINDVYCKMAKEKGIKFSISTDAHSIRELGYMKFGINQARRGWVEAEDVINTRSLKEFLKLVKRK